MGHHELLQTEELFYETFILLLDALFQIPNKVSYQYVTYVSTKLLYTVPIEILRPSIFLSYICPFLQQEPDKSSLFICNFNLELI